AADVLADRIDGDDVPPSKVEAVIALLRIAGLRAEIAVIPSRPAGLVIVVPRDRSDSRLHAAPHRIEAIPEAAGRPCWVHDVAEREDHAVRILDERRDCRCPVRAIGDVPGGVDHPWAVIGDGRWERRGGHTGGWRRRMPA